ncbi:hypothetical protein [Sediminibacter sp. Hel_I_10]|uniref:hypothetical protein n=1 Tax=Sediminibacter sp. Hel_I_10 TaxID=1392490 RepID=UPI0004794D1B|nr:hypothetical protein [Sediminibacter sp. Hel_I_10]
MSVILREVQHSDFDQIHNLFIEVYGKEPVLGFKKAFFDHKLLLGYCLIDDLAEKQPMVGYFGCFTYHRVIDGINYKFYNSHTWIVREPYRKQSLKLLMPYIRLKDGIVTNFSANGKVAQILEQLKFSKQAVVNFTIRHSFSLKSYIDQRKIKSESLENNITKWHEPYVGLSLNLKFPSQDKTIELILKPVSKKPEWVQRINRISKRLTKRPFITQTYFLYKVHYTNAPNFLMEHLDTLSHYLFLKEKVGGLIFPESLIENLPQNRIRSQYEEDIYLKQNQSAVPKLDYLYSEVFYLNIQDK